jgi:hypothetical protein
MSGVLILRQAAIGSPQPSRRPLGIHLQLVRGKRCRGDRNRTPPRDAGWIICRASTCACPARLRLIRLRQERDAGRNEAGAGLL